MEIVIQGRGVDNSDNKFYYVSLWSHDSTWGWAHVPVEGESVSIPTGMHVLYDVGHLPVTPVLNLVIIDGGTLIF
jgi:hypothetical protein